MTGTWIGKTRSLSLWSHVNDYVNAYTTINKTPQDEPWYVRWKELITVHNIIKKKRDFQFIAYVITGNPEATVLNCLEHLFTIIPDLNHHIQVTTSNTNGNIQYMYKELAIESPPTLPTSVDNRYSAFSTDTDSSHHDADKELESILQSNTSTPEKPEIFDQALNNATSTLKKLSDYTDNVDTNDTATLNNEYIQDLNNITQDMAANYSLKIDEISIHNEKAIRHMHDEFYTSFCNKCEKVTNSHINKIDTYLNDKLREFDAKLGNRISEVSSRLNYDTIHTKSRTIPKTSPVQSSDTPIKQFGAQKSQFEHSQDQNCFNQNLKHEHQADIYYLQDRDFMKKVAKDRNTSIR